MGEIVEYSGLARGKSGRRADGDEGPREDHRSAGAWASPSTGCRAGIQVLVNLLLLGGHIGRPGAGTCRVRGHSNVQGDRTVGIWERPTGPFLDALSKEFHFDPPRHPGKDTVDTIGAMHDGTIQVFVGLGGNFLQSTPDTACTANAIRRCSLTAQIATTLNRGHLITGRMR